MVVGMVCLVVGIVVGTTSTNPPAETKSTYLDPDLQVWFGDHGEKASALLTELKEVMVQMASAGSNGNVALLNTTCIRLNELSNDMGKIGQNAPPHWSDIRHELSVASSECLDSHYDITEKHMETASRHIAEMTDALEVATDALAGD